LDIGEGLFEFSVTEPGTYALGLLSDENCSVDTDIDLSFTYFPDLTASISPVPVFCVGDTISLSADIFGGSGSNVNGSWSDELGNTYTDNPLSMAVTEPVTLQYTVIDDCSVPYTTEESLFSGQAYPEPSVSVLTDSICAGGMATFVHEDEIGPSSCIWTSSQGQVAIGCNTVEMQFDEPGNVDINLTTSSSAGCTTSIDLDDVVTVLPVPVADFEVVPSPGDIYAPTVQFLNTSSDADVFFWDFADGESSEEFEPSHDFPFGLPDDYIVCLEAVSDAGCADSTCQRVSILSVFTVHIPNAFTPDGDEINECFAPVINDVELAEYDFTIYDPWGDAVFHSTDRNECWNGAGAEDKNFYAGKDVYSFRLLVRPADTVEKQEFTGMVVLVR
jgi:gliding motility-associated-like protein